MYLRVTRQRNEAVRVCLLWIGSYASTAANKICANHLNEKALDEITTKAASHERTKYKGCNVAICHFVVLVFDEISPGPNVRIESSLAS